MSTHTTQNPPTALTTQDILHLQPLTLQAIHAKFHLLQQLHTQHTSLLLAIPSSTDDIEDISMNDYLTHLQSLKHRIETITNDMNSILHYCNDPVPLPKHTGTPNKHVVRTIYTSFPGALTNAELLIMIQNDLDSFPRDQTLLATSFCSDELNRPHEQTLTSQYPRHFYMGGLAGFPFVGLTGYRAMRSHVPDNGNCLIVYGSHVGIDAEGIIGSMDRKGKKDVSHCCGSSMLAMAHLRENGDVVVDGDMDHLDYQQCMVDRFVGKYKDRLEDAEDRDRELPFVVFESIRTMMTQIVHKGGREAGMELENKGKMAILGGIQINTPEETDDYFLPLTLEVQTWRGEVLEVLI